MTKLILVYIIALPNPPVGRVTRSRAAAPSPAPTPSPATPDPTTASSVIPIHFTRVITSSKHSPASNSVTKSDLVEVEPVTKAPFITVSKCPRAVKEVEQAKSGGGSGGKNCCRNGTKQKSFSSVGAGGKKASGGGGRSAGRVGNGGKDKVDREEESDDGVDSGGEIGQKRKKRALRKSGPLVWLTDGTPPPLPSDVEEMLMELGKGLGSTTGSQSLLDLVIQLMGGKSSLPTPNHHSLSIGALINQCIIYESKAAVEEFQHMVSLIQLAFNITR